MMTDQGSNVFISNVVMNFEPLGSEDSDRNYVYYFNQTKVVAVQKRSLSAFNFILKTEGSF